MLIKIKKKENLFYPEELAKLETMLAWQRPDISVVVLEKTPYTMFLNEYEYETIEELVWAEKSIQYMAPDEKYNRPSGVDFPKQYEPFKPSIESVFGNNVKELTVIYK